MTGPIFIAGCGRSGTSLLRTMLDAHPDIYIPGESLFITDYLRHADSRRFALARKLFFREPQLKCWYDGPEFEIRDYAAAVARAHEAMARRSGARVWGQKTPRFVRHIALFDRVFPDAKWILVYRDPRAVVASMLRSGQHTNSIYLACRRWLRDNEIILRLMNTEAGNDRFLFVKYEDMIRDYDRTLEDIFRFVGVEPVTAEYVEAHAQPVFFSRSRFRINTVRSGVKPDPDKLEAWRNVLSRREIACIEWMCADVMRRLGYQTPGGMKPQRLPLVWYAAKAILDLRIVFRYLLLWPEYLFHTAARKLVLAAYGLRT